MRKILSSRLFRILVCLALICCILVNSSPIKAEATGGAALLGVIKGATLVSVPVAVWAAAALIAIGVTVDWVTDPNYNSYDALVNNVSTFLTDAGTYVKDGMVEMYRVVDETGKAVYYAAGDAMEAVRSWLFDSGTVGYSSPDFSTAPDRAANDYDSLSSEYNYVLTWFYDSRWHFVYSNDPLYINLYPYDGGVITRVESDSGKIFQYHSVTASGAVAGSVSSNSKNIYGESWYWSGLLATKEFVTLDGLVLGQVSVVPIDGTGAREWSEEYTNNGLYIVGSGGSGNNNPNNGKWFWPLAFGLTAAELYAMSQADQWAGETPSEFSDYEVKEDYSVSPGQEVEFGQSVELTPDPSANPDPGTGTNPGTGTDPGTDSGSSSWTPPSDYTQFQLVDLKNFFPFCIPFDLFEFFKLLHAEPVAPVLHWEMHDLAGETYSLTIDLSEWDSVALLFRRLQLFLFITGLAAASRKFIKW